MEEKTKQKTKKILNIVVNVLVVLILVIALLVTINNIASSKKGYTSIFGSTFLVVQTNSMDAPKPEKYADKRDGFAVGDLISVKILSEQEKMNLEEGDIISFFCDLNNDGQLEIESHRIVKVQRFYDEDGNVTRAAYNTKGDNTTDEDPNDPWVIASDQAANSEYYLIGTVTGNLGGIGNVFSFFQSSTGFLVCIVIPSFLVVIYFAFNLAREILKTRKAGAAESEAKKEEEIIARLRAQGLLKDDVSVENTTPQTDGGTGESAAPETASAEQSAPESEGTAEGQAEVGAQQTEENK